MYNTGPGSAYTAIQISRYFDEMLAEYVRKYEKKRSVLGAALTALTAIGKTFTGTVRVVCIALLR